MQKGISNCNYLKKMCCCSQKETFLFWRQLCNKKKEIASSSRHTYHDSCPPSRRAMACFAKHRRRLNFALFFINFDAPLRGQYACYVCLMFKLQKIKYKNLPLFDRDERKKESKMLCLLQVQRTFRFCCDKSRR